MAENIHEVEDTVKLAKDLGVRIVLSVAHEYYNTDASAPQADEIRKIAKQLIELKRKGYPIMNSISYFKVIAKEKNWQCKPWAMVNIDPNGKVVLPCYVHNDYASSVSIFETGIKSAVSEFDWEKIQKLPEMQPSLLC